MLALRVLTGEAAAAADRPPSGYETADLGDVRLLARAGPPYGFRVDLDDGVAVGESVSPVAPERIRAAATATGDLALPDELLGLVVLDAIRLRVRAAASLRAARPYYVHVGEGTFTIATSLSALRGLGVAIEADERRLGEVLVYRFVAPPNTLCKGVRRLVGGETLAVDLARGGEPRVRAPVFPAAGTEDVVDEADALDRARRALADEVRLGLERRRAPAVLLSGGVDSSVLAALARHGLDEVRSWSASFAFVNPDDREDAYAGTMASALGADHRLASATPERYLAGLVHGVAVAEVPLHHLQSGMLHLLFEEAAAAGHDALMCGEGADGLFGTDLHQRIWKHRRLLSVLGCTGLRAVLRLAMRVGRVDSERLGFLALDYGDDASGDAHVLHTLGAYGNPSIVQERFGCPKDAVRGARPALFESLEHLDLLQRISALGLLLEASATMGIWGSLAEHAGLALPCPYTGPEVVRALASTPWSLRLEEPKHLARALLRAEGVPEPLVVRPKLSFGLPYRYWALEGALFQPLVDMAGSMFDPVLLRSLQTEAWDEAMILWSALGWYLWVRLVVEEIDAEDLAGEVLDRWRRGYGAVR